MTTETDSITSGAVPDSVRQAVVIVHGMGEQRPLDMLNGFIDAAIPSHDAAIPDGEVRYFSRPEEISGTHEGRRFVARSRQKRGGSGEAYAQTEFFEYHWAHMMQGNKLSDVLKTVVRILGQLPGSVPVNLRGAWALIWLFSIWVGTKVWESELGFEELTDIANIVSAVISSTVVASIVTWALVKLAPGKITASFVDVVRYLDASPRSYKARADIRSGMTKFLRDLHTSGRYERIIIVAHSLGAYVAYDGMTSLWNEMNKEYCKTAGAPVSQCVIEAFEEAAAAVQRNHVQESGRSSSWEFENWDEESAAYQEAQRALWLAMREKRNPWLITDFITCGTPMYLADQIMTKDWSAFRRRILRRELPTCPPQPDLDFAGRIGGEYSYPYPYPTYDRTVFYHGAPFSVVRWTNMWFPAKLGLFGDWFGGPLRPLFGRGIHDIKLDYNKLMALFPALAHTKYFAYPNDLEPNSPTSHLHAAMALDSTEWLEPTLSYDCPEPDAVESS